jgi:N-acetylglucosamine-6-sulfatase
MRRGRNGAGGAARLVIAAAALVAVLATAPGAEATGRPNIVVITTDDQPFSTHKRKYMPRLFGELVDKGISFSQAVQAVPLCCPARATLVTGQYPHNHGVTGNQPGYPNLIGKNNVLPVWLKRAGYRTAHVGKWMHGYEGVAGTTPAPGWDRWFTQLDVRRYWNYDLSVNGRRSAASPSTFSTTLTRPTAGRRA